MKLRSFFAVPILFLGTMSARCAVVVTTGNSAPTENIIQSNFPTNPNTNLSDTITGSSPTYLDQGRGQQFQVAEKVLLQSISIYTQAAWTGGSFTLYIDRFTGTETTGTYEVISQQTGTLASSGTGNWYLHFALDDEVLLQTGEIYGFRIGFSSESASISIALRNKNTAPASSSNTVFGEQYYRYVSADSGMQKTNWAPNFTDNSLQIAYYLTGVPAPIPEPGAVGTALLGGATLGVFFLLGRRRK